MGIYDNVEFTIREKAERGFSLPITLSVKNIAKLWSDDDRDRAVFVEAMQKAIERRILKIQPGRYYSLETKMHGNVYDYSFVFNDDGSIRVEWIYDESIKGLCADIDPLAKISKCDFMEWLKNENEPLPKNCLLEKWYKDSVLEAEADGSKSKTTSINITGVFSKFKNLRCNEISIVMSDKIAKIVIRSKIIKVTPDELGLSEENQGWKLLLAASLSSGNLSNGLGKLNSSSDLDAERKKVKTIISRLRNSLKSSMGLADDPIIFSKNAGYRFNFKVMSNELLKSNVSHDSDAMDYVEDYSPNHSRRGNDGFWNDDAD
jgi:hypothetical protein